MNTTNTTIKTTMKRKLAVIFLALALVFTGLTPLHDVNYADADSYYGGSGFTGKNCTSNKTAAACIDYVIKKYPAGSEYPGTGECWGYAETVSNLLAASKSTKFYKGLKFTKKNFLNKCLGVKAGTHLRMSNSKTFNGYYGHSVVLLKVTEDDVIWADNNGTGAYNIVAYHRSTADGFVYQYGYQFEYLNMVARPTKYRISSESKLAAAADNEAGVINLAWTRALGAARYEIYRSYTKNGTYKKIGKTTSASYTDSTAELGSKAYYKVKAVKSGGSTMSNIGAGLRRLATPQVTAGNDANTGNPQLSWEPVKGATSYTVYRLDAETGKMKKLKNTTKCTFIDQSGGEAENSYWTYYTVKAIYGKNSKGNSAMSDYVYAFCQLPAPENLTAVYYDKQIHLTWTPVAGADGYEIYCCDTIDGQYQWTGNSYGASYVEYWYTPGTWYFRVKTRNGMVSEPISVQIQDWETSDREYFE